MKTEAEKQILYDSESAARFVDNIKGWVDNRNRFYGNNPESEHMARWSSCTHTKCECGEIVSKGHLKCGKCREKSEIENYNKLEYKEYDGSLVYSYYADKYFYDSDEIEAYCFDEEIKPAVLRLVFCEPQMFRQVDSDYWEDVLPEDLEGELPTELQKALDNLNKVIETLPPASYFPGNTRTIFKESKQ